jgi:hypothetical protein
MCKQKQDWVGRLLCYIIHVFVNVIYVISC